MESELSNNMDSQSITIENLSDIPLKRKVSFDPSKRVALSWHDLDVYVKPPSSLPCFRRNKSQKEMKQLLHNVNGEISPGTLLAIMGSSGAGKTTLLNVLTHRNTRKLHITGEVLLNGHNVGGSIRKMAAYVQQDDLFIGTMTVKEQLIFHALLKMDKEKTYKERMERVDEVIFELGLSKCENTTIGIPGVVKGISGGERKRLSFACEVLTNPALMFCDEPTSGLDSFMSQSIVSVLRDMAQGGRTIIFTIHQPSSELFEIFDHLLLMAEGRIAYKGKASDAISFFERAGYPCPVNYNPADHFVYNLAIVPGKEEECRSRIAQIVSLYSTENTEVKNNVKNISSNLPYMENITTDTKKYKASWCAQFRALFWRCWISMIRDKFLTRIRIIQTIVLGVVFGLIYLQQKLDEKGVMNLNGALFLILLTTNIRNLVAVSNSFCAERPLLFREYGNGMYSVNAYYICKTLVESPFTTVQSMILVVITYWMIGFYQNFLTFLNFVLIISLTVNTATSFGYFVSCLAPNVNVANNICATLVMPLQLFGGFYLNAASVPAYMLWVKYISWFYYGNEALMVNQWRYVQNITCSTSFCEADGKAVLEKYNFREENFISDIFLILVLLIFFRVLGYLILLLRANRKT